MTVMLKQSTVQFLLFTLTNTRISHCFRHTHNIYNLDENILDIDLSKLNIFVILMLRSVSCRLTWLQLFTCIMFWNRGALWIIS